eukprot:691512-Heterocapsa_arctica.AAC.1
MEPPMGSTLLQSPNGSFLIQNPNNKYRRSLVNSRNDSWHGTDHPMELKQARGRRSPKPVIESGPQTQQCLVALE